MPEAFKPKILIGADPEVFVKNVKTGMLVSVHDILPGTKDKPFPCDYGAMQVDGLAAEFNITPAPSNAHFVDYIKRVMDQVKAKLGAEYQLVINPVADFDPDYFNKLPEKVKELGCNPDTDAYTGQNNPTPDTSANPFMRGAAGHLHFGWREGADVNDPDHRNDCFLLVKQLDFYLGIMTLLWDKDNRRRTQYGMAGACRVKPYGVEYRVPSNAWLRNDRLMRTVYNYAYNAIMSLFNGGDLLEETYGTLARDTINGSVNWWDREKKHDLLTMCSKYGFLVPYEYEEAEPKKVANAKYPSATAKMAPSPWDQF
jgi:hypothetical protein